MYDLYEIPLNNVGPVKPFACAVRHVLVQRQEPLGWQRKSILARL